MASFTDKKLSEVYKDILHTSNSNTGLSTTTKQITCGDGDGTSLYLSNQLLGCIPAADNTTVFLVRDADSNNLLAVDTTNDLVKAGIGQHIVNTQYAHFGIGSVDSVWAGSLANTHYAVPFNGYQQQALVGGGTSTDPATSFTISTEADDIVSSIWHVIDNITIDKVVWWLGGDASAADTVRVHLHSYTIVTSAGSTGGDLSDGTVLAAGSDISNNG